MAEGTRVDTLYADLELRTEKYAVQVKAAEASLAKLEQTLAKDIPGAATLAATSIVAPFKAAADLADRSAQQQISSIEGVRAASLAASREQQAATVARVRAEADAMIAAGAVVDKETGRIRTHVRQAATEQAAAVGAAAAAATNLANAQKAAAAASTTAAASVAATSTAATGLASVIAGPLGGALSIAATALVSYFLSAREEIDKTDRQIQQLIDRAKARRDSPVTVLNLELEQVRESVRAANEELNALVLRQAQAKALRASGVNEGFAVGEDVAAVQEAVKKFNDLQAQQIGIQRQLNEVRKRGFDEQQQKLVTEAQQLGQILRSGSATEAQLQRITELRKIYSEVARRSAGTDLRSLADQTRALQILDALEGKRAERAKKPDFGSLGDSTAIERANKALDELRRNRARTEAEIADQAVAATKSLVDDMLLELGRLETKLRAEGLSEEQIAIFTKPKREAIALQEKIEELAKDNLPALSETLKRSLQELNDKVERPLRGKVDNPFDLGPYLRQQEEAKRNALELGRNIELSARAGLQLAEAFGLVDERTSRALQGVTQIAAAIPGVLSGNPASIASAIGGIASLFSRKDDPAEQERKRQHQENLSALRAIERHTGDLVGVSASGSAIVGARRAVGSFLAGVPQQRPGGNDGGRINDAGRLQLERLSGLSMKELEALASSLGVTLDGTVRSYRAFLEALTSVDLEAFTDGFRGKLRQLEIEARLDPKAFEGIEGLIKRLKVLTGPDGAPAIAKALEGIDVTTVEGRAQAIEALSAVLRNISSLKPEDLGGLSLDEFIEEILRAIEGMRELAPKVKSAAEQFAEAFAILQESFEVNGTDAAGRAKALADLFAKNFKEFEGLAAGEGPNLEAVKQRFSQVFAAAISDGTIDESERAVIEAFKALIGALEAEINEAEARAQAQKDAENDIRVRELRVKGYDAEADALERQLKNEAELNALRLAGVDEATIAQLQLVQALEAAADAARAAAAAEREKAAADRARADFAADVNIQFLRSQGRIKEAELAELQARHNARVERAKALGFDQETVNQINAIYQAELDEWNKKWGAAAESVQEAAGGGGGGGGERSTIANAATSLTERTGNRMADYLTSGLVLDRERNELLRQILAAALGTFRPALPPDLGPSFGTPRNTRTLGGDGGAITVNFTLNVNANGGIVGGSFGSDAEIRALLDQLTTGAPFRLLLRRISTGLADESTEARRRRGDNSL